MTASDARPPSDTGATGWAAIDECEFLPGCCSDEHLPGCPEAGQEQP